MRISPSSWRARSLPFGWTRELCNWRIKRFTYDNEKRGSVLEKKLFQHFLGELWNPSSSMTASISYPNHSQDLADTVRHQNVPSFWVSATFRTPCHLRCFPKCQFCSTNGEGVMWHQCGQPIRSSTHPVYAMWYFIS